MYLNQIYFGQGAYGIESASMYYFNNLYQSWISPKLLLWQLFPRALTILILLKIRRKVKNVRSLLSTRWLNTVLSLLPTVMLPKQKSLSSAQHIKPFRSPLLFLRYDYPKGYRRGWCRCSIRAVLRFTPL